MTDASLPALETVKEKCPNGHVWSSSDCAFRDGEWDWPCDCGELSRDFPPDEVTSSSAGWQPNGNEAQREIDAAFQALIENGGTQTRRGLPASIAMTLASMNATREALIRRAQSAEAEIERLKATSWQPSDEQKEGK